MHVNSPPGAVAASTARLELIIQDVYSLHACRLQLCTAAQQAVRNLYSTHVVRMHVIHQDRTKLKLQTVKTLLPPELGTPSYHCHTSACSVCKGASCLDRQIRTAFCVTMCCIHALNTTMQSISRRIRLCHSGDCG